MNNRDYMFFTFGISFILLVIVINKIIISIIGV